MFDGYRQSHFLRVQNPRFLCKSDEGLANRVLGRPGLTPQAKKSGYSMDWKPSYVCWILLVYIIYIYNINQNYGNLTWIGHIVDYSANIDQFCVLMLSYMILTCPIVEC